MKRGGKCATFTFHGVVEQLEVVLSAWIKTSFEVALQSPCGLDSLHDSSLLFPLLLASRSQAQVVSVTLGQHATKVLLDGHHLHIGCRTFALNIFFKVKVS